jgi:hypothetical protein
MQEYACEFIFLQRRSSDLFLSFTINRIDEVGNSTQDAVEASRFLPLNRSIVLGSRKSYAGTNRTLVARIDNDTKILNQTFRNGGGAIEFHK